MPTRTKLQYDVFAQSTFTKTFNGDPQVGFALRGRFYAPFGLELGKAVDLREQKKMSGSVIEYSTDGGRTWRHLPAGREI